MAEITFRLRPDRHPVLPFAEAIPGVLPRRQLRDHNPPGAIIASADAFRQSKSFSGSDLVAAPANLEDRRVCHRIPKTKSAPDAQQRYQRIAPAPLSPRSGGPVLGGER